MPAAAPALAATALPPALRGAVLLLRAEALALGATAVLVVVKTVTGRPDSLGRALLAAGMALLCALVLAGCGRGLRRRRRSVRTPALVIQLLAVPVAYSLWFQAGLVGYGAPMMIAALATIYLLFTPATRAALEE